MKTTARWWVVAWRWFTLDWYIVEWDFKHREWIVRHTTRDFRIYPGLDLNATHAIADSLNHKP